MKPNRFKQVVEQGGVAVGHMLDEFGTRGMARILESAGVDFVLLDTEHSGFTIADIADLVAWFSSTSVAPFVRVPQIEYHLIARCLDAGALGVMIPDVRSGAEAKAVVDATKYPPAGRRRVSLGGGNTGYQVVDGAEFLPRANQNTTVICQIESEEGLASTEEIAGTPGVDVLWVGQADLSQSMGIFGQYHHPRFRSALRLVVETARSHGQAVGIQPGNLTQAQEWLEIGFNIISYGDDIRLYKTALTEGVAAMRALAAVAAGAAG